MPFWTLIRANLAPTWPQLGLQNPSKTGLKTILKRNFLKSWFLQPLQCEMQVFASPRGSKNEQKLLPRPLVIQVLFQLQKNTLPTSILVPLGPLLGAPRRLQEASKPSPKPLLEASWAILAASSIFWPPGGYPRARFFLIFDKILMLFSRLWSSDCFYSATPLHKELPRNYFEFSASQRHNRVPWIVLLSFFLLLWGCFCSFYFVHLPCCYRQVLNVTIVFHGLPWFCINYLLAKPPIAAAAWAKKPTWICASFRLPLLAL